jgi:uncharacterized protein YggE
MIVSLSSKLSRRRAVVTAAGAAATGLALSTRSSFASSQSAGALSTGLSAIGEGMQGIVVTGTATASTPATSAVIQYILRYDPSLPMPVPEDQASPAASGGMAGGYSSSAPAPDEGDLAGVAEALVNAGVPEASVKVFPGTDIASGPFGPGTAVVAASIEDAALLGDLTAIIEAGAVAAREAGLSIDQVGAIYNTSTCGDTSDEALASAIANAKDQAAVLAKALQVELGDLVGATMQPTYSPYSGYIAGSSGCDGIPGLDDADTTYFPMYTATAEPQFSITASVTLSFAMGETAA